MHRGLGAIRFYIFDRAESLDAASRPAVYLLKD